MPVYVGILLDSERVKTVRILEETFLGTACEDSLFYRRSINRILILGYGAGALGQVLYAPWFRYLLGGL